ncbi:MAG TPA: YHS domain-containing protein [Propionicimonas sp.]|nr:YHS domain-containing protein [Propionicimonas sp.]HQA78480.1 YHS domain-containing protein [Propionicimonas sp.]HQD97631.1 YHS domain-containing protein [Propionicimonas sp.]
MTPGQDTCAVCGMPIEDGVDFTSVNGDQTYRFCSQACQDTLADNPGPYANSQS